MSSTSDKLITYDDCLNCGERKTTTGCKCSRIESFCKHGFPLNDKDCYECNKIKGKL